MEFLFILFYFCFISATYWMNNNQSLAFHICLFLLFWSCNLINMYSGLKQCSILFFIFDNTCELFSSLILSLLYLLICTLFVYIILAFFILHHSSFIYICLRYFLWTIMEFLLNTLLTRLKRLFTTGWVLLVTYFLDWILLKDNPVHSLTYCPWLFSCFNCRDEQLMAENTQPTTSKVFTIQLLPESIYQPWSRPIGFELGVLVRIRLM